MLVRCWHWTTSVARFRELVDGSRQSSAFRIVSKRDKKGVHVHESLQHPAGVVDPPDDNPPRKEEVYPSPICSQSS